MWMIHSLYEIDNIIADNVYDIIADDDDICDDVVDKESVL